MSDGCCHMLTPRITHCSLLITHYASPLTKPNRNWLESSIMNMKSTSSPFQLLVFDWDGTLMDSEARIVACLGMALADLDLPSLPRERLSNVIGLGLPEAVRNLLPTADEHLMTRFIERYRLHFLAGDQVASTLFPGVLETLRRLGEAGFMLAVATGKSRRGLDRSLAETGCADLFVASRCADECFSKPHPQMLLEIMADLDTPPHETLMIGDTEYDLQMAGNAGTAALAVSYGVHERARLLQHGPLACLDDIAEIIPWLGVRHGGREVVEL